MMAPPILQIIWKSESSKYLALDKEFTNPRFECFNGCGFLFTNMEDVTPKVQGVDPQRCFMYRARVGLWYQHTSSFSSNFYLVSNPDCIQGNRAGNFLRPLFIKVLC